MDKVILCVAMYVSRTVLTFSTGSFKLHEGERKTWQHWWKTCSVI